MARWSEGVEPVAAVERSARAAVHPRWEDVAELAGGPTRGAGSRAGVPERAPAASATVHVPQELLAALVNRRERIAVVAGPTGAVRVVAAGELAVPVAADGSPDVAAVFATGGWLRGAMPPKGLAGHTSLGALRATYHAAGLDLAEGAGPRFVRGALLEIVSLPYGGVHDTEAYLAEVQRVAATVRRLPASMAEFRARRREDFFGSHAGSRFDADL